MPKIINPFTGQKIKPGSATHKRLVKKNILFDDEFNPFRFLSQLDEVQPPQQQEPNYHNLPILPDEIIYNILLNPYGIVVDRRSRELRMNTIEKKIERIADNLTELIADPDQVLRLDLFYAYVNHESKCEVYPQGVQEVMFYMRITQCGLENMIHIRIARFLKCDEHTQKEHETVSSQKGGININLTHQQDIHNVYSLFHLFFTNLRDLKDLSYKIELVDQDYEVYELFNYEIEDITNTLFYNEFNFEFMEEVAKILHRPFPSYHDCWMDMKVGDFAAVIQAMDN